MDVSRIVEREGNPCCSELPGSSSCDNVGMGEQSLEELAVLPTTEKDTAEEKNLPCENVSEMFSTETDPVEEENMKCDRVESFAIDADLVKEENLPCVNASEMFSTETDPVLEANMKCNEIESFAADLVKEENLPCENESEMFSTETDPVEEEKMKCDNVQSFAIDADLVKEDNLPCEKVSKMFSTETDPVEEENMKCDEEESFAIDADPVNKENLPCENVSEMFSTVADPVEEKIHCGKVESLAIDADPVNKENLPCENVSKSLSTETGPVVKENFQCERVESLATVADPIKEDNHRSEDTLESLSAENVPIEEENTKERVPESLSSGTDSVKEDNPSPEELLSSSTIEKENSLCEMIPKLSSAETDSNGKEDPICEEQSLSSGIKKISSFPTDVPVEKKGKSLCVNLPASSMVEENEVVEEEIPLAEVVTLYSQDVDSLQYNDECQSSDPLAFEQENGDPTSISIKDEPIDDSEENEILPLQDVTDEICIKIENENGHSLAFGESESFEDKEFSQNFNLDNLPANCSESAYDSFLPTQNDFHSEISPLDNMSKLHGKAFELPSADISKDTILGDEQNEIDEKLDKKWHSVTVIKQEDVQENVVNRNKNQALNPYMVKIPLHGYQKSEIGTMRRVFACEFCGKAFKSSLAQRGHLAKCQQRRRSILEFSKKSEPKQNTLGRKPLSSHKINEDAVKPTVQLRNSFNTKKNYLHYDCDLCEKAFPTLQGFAIHSRRHAEIRMDFKCRNCQQSFPTREKLSYHCKRSGHHFKKLKCSFCSKAFFTKLSLRKHEEIHDLKEYVFCCSICNKSFENAIKLHKHNEEHHQSTEKNLHEFKKTTDNCSCSVCGQIYKSVKRLIRHMKWHANEKYNTCPVCKKKFLNKNNLRKHKILHQEEGKFCCDLCDKVFESLAYLRKHTFRHTGNPNVTNFASPLVHTCDRCQQSYSSLSGLWGHSAHCRGKRMKKKKFLTGNKSESSKFQNFQPVQNEVIILNSKIKIKIKRKETRQVLENLSLPAIQDSNFKMNKCDLCKKTYSSQRNLERHRQIHFGQMVSDTENSILCGICGNLFSSNITLLRHERLHKVGKQFLCLICRKIFPASRNLKIHMHSHRNEDKDLFNCDICEKAFSSEIHLKYHRRTHSDAHTCLKCQKSFSTFQGLNSHRRFCPSTNFGVEHMASSSSDYNIGENVFRTPPSAITRNRNEKIMLKSSKPLQVPLNNICNICNKKFSSQVLLKYHLRQHSSEASLTCFNCKKTFETIPGLKGHLSHCPVRHVVMAGLQSRLDETLQCHICKKTTNNLENFMSHMRTHAKDLSFSCDICGKVLSTSQARRIHIKRHHGDREVFMTSHPVKPITAVKKAISKQVTTSQKYGFSSTSHSSRSVVSVKNAQPSVLSRKEQNYKSNFIVKRSNGLEKFLCTICNKVLLSRKNLKFHSYLHSGDSPYKCDICGVILHSAGALKTHTSRHSRERRHTNQVYDHNFSDEFDNIQPESLKNNTEKIEDQNFPEGLNTLFMKEAVLQASHEKRMFQCNYCPRTFDGISKRRNHEASHLRALRCSVCGGSFRTHKEFKEHVCADNFFPLLCEHCGVQFTDDLSFTSHRCDIE